MPGNPLPKIEINASRWPYDENGPVNGKFGEVEVTAAPKAVFDADSDPSQLIANGLQSGHIKILESAINTVTDEVKYPNELVPNGGGSRGWNLTYPGKLPVESDNQGKEINYEIMAPASRTWDYLRIWQPDNYYSRRYGAFVVPSAADVNSWEIGDVVTSSTTGRGVIYEKGEYKGIYYVYLDQLTGGHINVTFNSGKTITNQRTGEQLVSSGSRVMGENAKHHIRWVDDSYVNGGGHNGYSNGSMSMEVDCTPIESDDLSGDGIAAFKISTSAGGNSAKGERFNEIGPKFNFYDTDDNGSWVNFVFEFKRASGEGASDGAFRLWKMTEREGGAYPNWTLVFESTGQDVWSPYQENNFTHGYLFGNKNGSYIEDTTFYLNRWEYWTQKPTFLIEAGM